MSRSYKKTPVVKDNGPFAQFARKQSNKRVRRTGDLSNGCNYKRVYPQYSICERRSYIPFEDRKDDKHWRKIIGK